MQGLVVDPAAGGNMLRYVNDAIGFPEGYRNTVATVEVFDYATLRPHIFFYTTEDVKAGEELLMDYGVEFHRFIKSEARRAQSLVDAREGAAAAVEAVRDLKTKNGKLTRQLRVAKNESSELSTLLAEARDDVEKEQRLVRAANALVAGLEEDKKDLSTKVQSVFSIRTP
ncbi:hypothetical protein COCSUDRAFT_60516 [Coccomyxa subellipsoidea C-169]|uniref:SET domain-containing protein n=1 Tax=Coccomyxa subellipsoidea (strain C-169) TaxID=574566 RepID=I0YIC3_COCSC|nr:hypothetical protein COCSUDRAFT_60516 [Coccomyxa subellipsoidea C-169]EIE18142.1 hypothetical protein COCSUDRAFT_60516 [Coccomyxa subellipsoidea C-169]|eukprot:XP_005642686.1 hypothetical protein COCSUDRAFT_60516 [Coccomyxa subellipsoidea C-169]